MLLLLNAPKLADLVPKARRFLEGQGLSSRCHGDLKLRGDRIGAALEKEERVTQVGPVARLIDEPHAGTATAPYLKLKAGPASVSEVTVRAAAQSEKLLKHSERFSHGAGGGKGSEQRFPLPLPAAPKNAQARKVLVFREGDHRVGLIVSEKDVEGRALRFNETLLE